MKLILKSFLLASAFVLPSAFGADTPLAQDTTASPQDAVEVFAPLSLERLQPSRQESTLYRVPFDNLRLVTGSVYVNKDEDEVMFILGGLDLKGLATLARVSRTLNGLVRPVIDAAKLWWRTNVVPRGLPKTITDYDRGMLGLFKVNSVDGFDLALAVAMDGRIIMNPLVHLGAGYPESQNTILSILLNPDSTVTDIQRSAAGLRGLGPDYVDRAATLYEKAAKDPRATLYDIRTSAAGLTALGSAYYPRAADLYEEAAKDPRATLYDIRTSAAGLRRLGSEYNDRAADLYEKAAKDPRATLYDIRTSAAGLTALGSAYYPRAADLYEEAAKDPRADLNDIQDAAAGLRRLGSEYNDRAAKLYELAIRHPEATNDEINTIIEILGELGPKYREEAIALWESLKGNK